MATGGGVGVKRRRKAGLPGLCWKTCYFPILFWVVSVCGEENTFIVEVTSDTQTQPFRRKCCAFACTGMNIASVYTPISSILFCSVLRTQVWSGVVRSSGCFNARFTFLHRRFSRSLSLSRPVCPSHKSDIHPSLQGGTEE